MSDELLSPLYSVPNGYECETIFGLFSSCAKWKEHAREELKDWLTANRETRKTQND